MILGNLSSYELTHAHFESVKTLLYDCCGIDLRPGKEGLVRARLGKRLRALGMGGFDEYLEHVRTGDGRTELALLIDAMTTNKTSFFREAGHFDFLRAQLLPEWARNGRIRAWSAACSSGEEPFTLAMVLMENVPGLQSLDVRILATDISSRVLECARRGIYASERLQDVPVPLRSRYFQPLSAADTYEIDARLRRMVRFAQLNLMESWPMKGPFDVIFCRNAMIYFDKETQGRLINRFYHLLTPGGHLFIGHSESLTGITHPFRYVQPAVYAR